MEGDAQYGQAIVLDMSGTVQVPNRPYPIVEAEMNKVQRGHAWPSIEAMVASIKQNAPEPHGLPDGAPNPNTVYLKNGQYVRYVVDTSERQEPYVVNGVVTRDVPFTVRQVSLSLEGARRSAANGNLCDYWLGFTWVRNGYTPERDFPVMAQKAAAGVEGSRLVFSQAVSRSDEAQVRHAMAAVERANAPLPVETAATISGEVTAAASVPFPEATTVTYDAEAPTDDFVPPAPEPSKRPARATP